MSEAVELLKTQAERLSREERAELARFLLASLEPEENEAEVAAAWGAELQRRLADFKAGKATARPVEEVFTELRRRYA